MPPADESAILLRDETAAAPPLERFRMFIDGAWCDAESGQTFETKNPYTGQAWATLPQADTRDVDRAVQAAHAAFSDGPWAGMTASDRGLLLYRLADAIAADAERLAEVVGHRVVVDLRQRAFLRADHAREVAEMVDGERQVGQRRLADGLAVVERLDHGDELELLLQNVGDAVEHLAAVGRRGASCPRPPWPHGRRRAPVLCRPLSSAAPGTGACR